MKSISIIIITALVLGFASCNKRTENTESEQTLALDEHGHDHDHSAHMNENIVSETEMVPEGPLASVKYKETEFDFGSIKEGEVVNHTFVFTNTSDMPLIIQDATASCGCTVPKKPKEPIQPGKTGEITVQFDSKGKPGQQNKTVTVTANTNPPTTILTIKSFVQSDKAAADGPVREKPQLTN